jgi:hypothetical protein
MSNNCTVRLYMHVKQDVTNGWYTESSVVVVHKIWTNQKLRNSRQ